MRTFERRAAARAQIELDHFRRARADEKQQLDVGAPLEEPTDDAIELVIGVGEAGEIALLQIAVAKRGSAKIITPAAD